MGAISTSVTLQGPFDLPLSLEAAARFLPPRGLVPTVLKVAARFDRRPAVFEIRQTRRSPPKSRRSRRLTFTSASCKSGYGGSCQPISIFVRFIALLRPTPLWARFRGR